MKKLEEEKVTVDLTKQNVSKEEGAVNRENIRIGRLPGAVVRGSC